MRETILILFQILPKMPSGHIKLLKRVSLWNDGVRLQSCTAESGVASLRSCKFQLEGSSRKHPHEKVHLHTWETSTQPASKTTCYSKHHSPGDHCRKIRQFDLASKERRNARLGKRSVKNNATLSTESSQISVCPRLGKKDRF